MIKIIGVNLIVAVVAFLGLEGLVRSFAGVRNVGPAFTEYHPIYGKSFKPSFSAERVDPEFRMRLTTNSQRYRGPEPQGPETGGVLFLGDSFTEGYGVNDGEEYAALIRQTLVRRHGAQAPPVINTGMSNTGNGRSLKILLREGRRLQPKAIVLQLMDNDFGDNHKDQLFTLTGGELREVPGPASGQPSRLGVHWLVETVPGLAHSHAIAALRQGLWGNSARHLYARSAAADELTYRMWERLFTVCQEARWPLVVLAVNLQKERLNRLQQMIAARRVPLVIPPTPAERPDLYYAMDKHWNQRGHQLIADLVMRAMDGAAERPADLSSMGHRLPATSVLP